MRTSLTSVGDLLFGQTRGRVLALLYGAPDETFFVRQIARQVETSVGTVQRELNLLADAGLIKRSSSWQSGVLPGQPGAPGISGTSGLARKNHRCISDAQGCSCAALVPYQSRLCLWFGCPRRGESRERHRPDGDRSDLRSTKYWTPWVRWKSSWGVP